MKKMILFLNMMCVALLMTLFITGCSSKGYSGGSGYYGGSSGYYRGGSSYYRGNSWRYDNYYRSGVNRHYRRSAVRVRSSRPRRR